MKKFCLMIFIAMLSTGCAPQKQELNFEPATVPEISVHSYFEIEEKIVGWNDIFNIYLNKYYVYYFSPTCSHCEEIKNWIIETALKRDDIFFVKASEKDTIKSDVSDTIGLETAENMKIMGYPSLIEITNWKVTKNVAGKTQIKNLID